MATTQKKRAGNDMVRVACKLPQGITIVIPPVGDNREKRVTLHGRYSRHAVADHGMTYVSADDWATIQLLHGDALWLKNEHVFAMADADSAADKAEERADVNAGFNKIDPKNPSETRGAGMIQVEGAADLGPTR
jgi:hypothetical protein